MARKKEGSLLDKLDARMEVRELPHAVDLGSLVCRGKLKLFCQGLVNRLMARVHSGSWRLNQWYTSLCGGFIPENYECVIAYHGTTSAVAANALYNTNARRKILWVHGDHRIVPEEISFFRKQYQKFDKIYCVSESIRSQFAELFPDAAGKSEVIHNVIDSNDIRSKANVPIDVTLKHLSLVTVGRLAREKGQEMIPKTTRMLLDSGYEIYWYLVGEGPMRSKIEEEVKKHGVEENVVLLGAKENPYPYIINGDIYVQPSLSEGWGLTVQEARILNKPIVVTPIPVMSEQIRNGENGLIVDVMSPEALAEGIKTLLDHPELREKFIRSLMNKSLSNEAELQKLYDFIEN